MAPARELPDRLDLLRRFSYDADAGTLRWKYREDASPQWNGRFAGKAAGSLSKSQGRMVVNVGGRLLLVHRVIWKMVYGADPLEDIDHIDGDPTNNTLSNLRMASKFENMRNARKRRGKYLPKGVSFHKGAGRYRATVYLNRQHVHLGLFSTPEEAHAAYCRVAQKHFGRFARFE